jgi:hypothetical protein
LVSSTNILVAPVWSAAAGGRLDRHLVRLVLGRMRRSAVIGVTLPRGEALPLASTVSAAAFSTAGAAFSTAATVCLGRGL